MLSTEVVVGGVNHGERPTKRRERKRTSLTVLPRRRRRRQRFLAIVVTITLMAKMLWLGSSLSSSSSPALSKSSFRFVSSWSTSMSTSRTRIRRHYHGGSLRAAAASAAANDESPRQETRNDQDNRSRSRQRQSQYQLKHGEMKAASRLQLAPMMEYTDRHFRQLVRLVSSETLLWTEMIAANTLAYERHHQLQELSNEIDKTKCPQDCSNDPNSISRPADEYSDEYLRRYLAQAGTMTILGRRPHQHHTEGPCVLQLGGSDPDIMHDAVETVMDMTTRGWCNYTALNLNVGCPSPKVAGKGNFGAALMDDPALVQHLCRSMYDASQGSMPITVKCRIGTDTHQPFVRGNNNIVTSDTQQQQQHDEEQEEYHRLCHFIDTVSSDGIVTDFTVHARIAVLQKSFSPADNRKVPPLKYHLVQKLVKDFPHLSFTLNGGIDTLEQAQTQLQACPDLAGIMIGRAWAADPWSFAMADSLLYNKNINDDDDDDDDDGDEASRAPPSSTTTKKNRLEILQAYGQHADAEELAGDPTKIRRFLTRAVTTLFTGEPNAKRYRIALDDIAGLPKKLQSQGLSLGGQPLLSDLILNAAHTHLSEDVLMRTPQESYERRLYEEEKRNGKQKILVAGGCVESRSTTTTTTIRSAAISEWQADRQKDGRRPMANDETSGGAVVEMNATAKL